MAMWKLECLISIVDDLATILKLNAKIDTSWKTVSQSPQDHWALLKERNENSLSASSAADPLLSH